MNTSMKSGWESGARIALGESNDCTVVAVATATDLPYEEVHAVLKRNGSRRGHGAFHHQVLDAVEELGFAAIEFNPMQVTVNYPAGHKELQNLTVKHFERFEKCFEWAKGRSFLVATRTHMLAVVDGKVQDWMEGRSFRVTKIWEIVPKEAEDNFDLGERLIANWPTHMQDLSPIQRRRWARNFLIEREVITRGLYLADEAWSEERMDEERVQMRGCHDKELYELAKQNSNAYRCMVIHNMIWKDTDGRIFSFEKFEPRFGFKPVNIDGTGWAHHYS